VLEEVTLTEAPSTASTRKKTLNTGVKISVV
jgi:hypothetical protein